MTRMAYGSLQEFDSSKESIESSCERYFVANNICNDGTRQKKTLFLTLLGQATYAKLKNLANLTSV